MTRLRVFPDTGVLLSMAIFPVGKKGRSTLAGEVLSLYYEGLFDLVISQEVVEQLLGVIQEEFPLPCPSPPLCHDLSIHCWGKDNPPVENPEEGEEATAGKGDKLSQELFFPEPLIKQLIRNIPLEAEFSWHRSSWFEMHLRRTSPPRVSPPGRSVNPNRSTPDG